MSKIIFICYRNVKHNIYFPGDIKNISNRIMPDNISPSAPLIINKNGILIGIFNPNNSLQIKNTSICTGNLINPDDEWWKPETKVPDGTYSLIRSDEHVVEVVSDIAASRTLWYIQTDAVFIASSSQRAIIYFLQDFKPNPKVFSWVLSSGTLGPGLSWDKRIRMIGANSRIVLDRSSWKLTYKKGSINFKMSDLSDEEHELQLKAALEYVFQNLRLDYSRWILPLSGGCDSRAILLMLKDHHNLTCITWGIKSSVIDKKSDTYIAESLAKYFNIKHIFFETDMSSDPIEVIINRFLVTGEGRVDHVQGYMDGFKIWKFLFEEKILGILRGDEGFGWLAVNTPFDVRRCVGGSYLEDYSNWEDLEKFKFEKQTWPENLQQNEKESLAMWRDRLYLEFRIPVMLSALTDLKCCYVEVINPLLSRKIVEKVIKMPDRLRTNKSLFKKMIFSMCPHIKFAEHLGTAERSSILKLDQVLNLIYNELNTTYAKTLLPDTFVDYILNKIKIYNHVSTKEKHSLRDLLNPVESRTSKDKRSISKDCYKKQNLDYNFLAFRAYIICRMNKILSADAMALAQDRQNL